MWHPSSLRFLLPLVAHTDTPQMGVRKVGLDESTPMTYRIAYLSYTYFGVVSPQEHTWGHLVLIPDRAIGHAHAGDAASNQAVCRYK